MIGAIILAIDGAPAEASGRLLWGGSSPVIANRPVVDHAIELLVRARVGHVVVVTAGPGVVAGPSSGHRARIDHVIVPEEAGVMAALLAALELLEPGLVLVHGSRSLVFRGLDDAIERFAQDELDMADLALPVPARVEGRGRGDVAFAAQPQDQPLGIQIVGPRAQAALAELEAERGQRAAFEGLAGIVRGAGGAVGELPVTEGWRFAGSAESLLLGNQLALAHALDGLRRHGARPVDVHGRIDVHPTATVRGSRLRGPIVIGPGAVVEDAYVGPYTSLGPEVRLLGSEIEHSIAYRGARIDSVGRIEDSVIGPGARVDRTFTRPAALRLDLGRGSRVSLS